MNFNLHYLLTASLSIMFLIQLFYFFYFFIRLSFHKNKTELKRNDGISVIIAARNEYENLKKYLPSILNQNYEDFEVIVVNDRSWDKTAAILEEFQKSYGNLKVVNIPDLGKDNFSKKFAITLGIKAAKNENLVFTDADCYALSNEWLLNISVSSNNTNMISLGAGPYKKDVGILNAIIRFDAAFIATQYLSMAKAKIPYMGVGRNLSYKKTIYNEIQGFKSHYHIPSGDDDLFVNQVANSNNTQVVFCTESLTYSIAEKTFKNWVNQKIRHLKTSSLYNFKTIFFLALYPISLFGFYISFISNLILINDLIFVLMLFTLRTLIQIIIFFKPLKIMGSKELIIFTPLLEIILLLIYPFLHIKKIQKL